MKNQFAIETLSTKRPMPCIEFMVEIPPSANSIWRSFKGRVIKSEAYTIWQETAQITLGRMGTVSGPVCVEIDIYMGKGWRSNRDLDNTVKPLIDLLKLLGYIEDDCTKIVQEIRMRALPPSHKDDKAIASVKVFTISQEKNNEQDAITDTTSSNHLNSIKKTSSKN